MKKNTMTTHLNIFVQTGVKVYSIQYLVICQVFYCFEEKKSHKGLQQFFRFKPE